MDAPSSRRPRALFLFGLLAILAALPAGYFLFLDRDPLPSLPAPAPTPAPAPVVEAPTPPPTPPPTPAPAPAQLAELKLTDFQGQVEVRQGDGAWRGAVKDEALHATDSVRTFAGSYAVLIGGKAVEVHMEAGSEVSVAELTEKLSRLTLRKGMTTVLVSSGTLELATEGSDAVARSSGGKFTLSNNGAGTVALASLEGETVLTSQQTTLTVRKNQQSIVLPGRAPSAPAPIPTSLLLKVNWPTRPRRQVVISGQTDPGTLVVANGQRATPDAQGRFSFPLTLKEGPNPVLVETLSVGGVPRREQQTLTVDTTPPKPVTVDPGLWNDPAPQPP